ncbi:MAG: precorrin-6A reductase [Eubacteriales bacterium]|nr:precorrin-6A reductase [Eubacteriales bacterium]
MCKICVFAGTSEGRELIEALAGRGAKITACVATEYGEVLLGSHSDVRILAGRMNMEEMTALLRNEAFDVVVDATHPYADVVTQNIAAACREVGASYLRLLRGSGMAEGDGAFVPDVASCVDYLRSTEGNILLTTGSKQLPEFCRDPELRARIYARVLPMQASLQTCADCGIAPDHIIAMQGPFDEALNCAMLRAVNARYMVTKDTGGAGGYGAKIAAAKRAGAQVVVIGRPAQVEGLSPEEMLSHLEHMLNLTPPRKRVVLAGLGMGNSETRTLGLERAIREADALIGAQRMLESVETAGKRCHTAVLARDVARFIRSDPGRRYAVLLSGDTGFYSGARGLVAELTDMDVEVLPGIGSLQYFCARLKRPWQDVRALSLHGRDCDFAGEVRRNPAVFALVGGSDGAHQAIARLCDAGLGTCTVHVGQRLGYDDERIVSGTAQELLNESFDPLSVVLVENDHSDAFVVTHGLPDEAFDRDETPMTKSEVRSISLSKLQLTRGAIVYDVGSGSGSVSVECALQATQGRVYAIEMKEKALSLTRHNAEKFGLTNLELVAGAAPDALESLPAPTHAFIGGSTGKLRGIIDCLLAKNPDVRIVANAVTLETVAELTELCKSFETCDIAEVSVSKPRVLGRYHLMTAQNPVYIAVVRGR